jgi:hypothetical protein
LGECGEVGGVRGGERGEVDVVVGDEEDPTPNPPSNRPECDGEIEIEEEEQEQEQEEVEVIEDE